MSVNIKRTMYDFLKFIDRETRNSSDIINWFSARGINGSDMAKVVSAVESNKFAKNLSVITDITGTPTFSISMVDITLEGQDFIEKYENADHPNQPTAQTIVYNAPVDHPQMATGNINNIAGSFYNLINSNNKIDFDLKQLFINEIEQIKQLKNEEEKQSKIKQFVQALIKKAPDLVATILIKVISGMF